jgi:hypothetical protein
MRTDRGGLSGVLMPPAGPALHPTAAVLSLSGRG